MFRPLVRLVPLVVLVLLALPAGADARTAPADPPPVVPATCVPATAPTATAAARRRGPRGPSIRTVLDEAVVAGQLSPEAAAQFRDVHDTARAVRRRLSGVRRTELSGAIRLAEDLARRRELTTARMALVFTTLQQNAHWWARSGPPGGAGAGEACAGGETLGSSRVRVGEIVFQWYPRQGLQIQQLGTAGRVNALARLCRERPRSRRCDRDRLRAGLDTLMALATDRGGMAAWEYFFGFRSGKAPWVSGLAQATAMQALARGSQVLEDPRYLDLARRGVGVFEATSPLGVRLPAEDGDHFLLYSFDPEFRVLNGFLQALVGLHDYAEIAGDDRARALFASGEAQARREVPQSDTGAWSLYSLGGAESDLGYHKLVTGFLEALCERTTVIVYCATGERFTEYLDVPAELRWRRQPRLRVRRTARTRFHLSKRSTVTLTVSRNDRTVATVRRLLMGGARTLEWRPPSTGEYLVSLVARDEAGHLTELTDTVRVRR